MKWRGREIYPPHVIVWRALWWPVVQALRLLLCAATLAGFGRDAAEHFWDATQ